MKTIILAAGFGSRLWPLSTSEKPKQFQTLIGDQSLLQHSYHTLARAIASDDLYVLTLAGLEHLVTEQLPQLEPSHIIAVPERRNILPHTLYVLATLPVENNEPVFFNPVDHYFPDPAPFTEDLKAVLKTTLEASNTYLLGIPARTIDPTLGYFLAGESGEIERFIEKPSPSKAEVLAGAPGLHESTLRYITSRQSMAQLLRQFTDSLSSLGLALLQSSPDEHTERFLAMPLMDISHGLFERVSGLQCLAVQSPYIDIGKFNTLYAINTKDDNGNVTVGDVALDGCTNNYIVNQLPAPLALIDLHDSVVIQTRNGSLVAALSGANRIGELYKSRILAK